MSGCALSRHTRGRFLPRWDSGFAVSITLVQNIRQANYRIPLEQALDAFTTLQRRGIESRFLYFPVENHWVLKPQNSVEWHAKVPGWLDRWTREGKWTDANRPARRAL